jgi:hypothetical protein
MVVAAVVDQAAVAVANALAVDHVDSADLAAVAAVAAGIATNLNS